MQHELEATLGVLPVKVEECGGDVDGYSILSIRCNGGD